MKSPIYLDYAAATPIDKRVLDEMLPYFATHFHNPSAIYASGRDAKRALDEARASVARSIGSRPSEIVFTAGGTESTNLAIKGVMDRFSDAELIVSAIEHEAVMKPAQNYNVIYAPVDKSGIVIVSELEKLITDKTALISIMYANNEVGGVQPIEKIAALVARTRSHRRRSGNTQPLLLHTDACQAPLYLDVAVSRIAVDMMTLNGGKMYGPKQSGILYVRAGTTIVPLIEGGGQEFGVRSGTENVAACVGFAKALELASEHRKERVQQMKELQEYFVQSLSMIPRVTMNGHMKKRLPNNIHVTIENSDNERVLFSLDDQGIYAAAGSACSASSEEASHVLLAMGCSADYARSSLRFTMGDSTTKRCIDDTITALARALTA